MFSLQLKTKNVYFEMNTFLLRSDKKNYICSAQNNVHAGVKKQYNQWTVTISVTNFKLSSALKWRKKTVSSTNVSKNKWKC